MEQAGIPPALTEAVDSIKEAISAGRTDIFRKLIETCEQCDGGGPEERRQLVNSFSNPDGTFLHMATKLGRGDIVRALLASGADPGVLDKDGNSPIQISPSPAMTAIFIEELLRATSQSEVGRVCQLIASGLSVNSVDNALSRNTPLHWAASFADLDTISCLIARGADVNSCNNTGSSPLHDAVSRGDVSIIEALIEAGANPNLKCHKGPLRGQSCFHLVKKNMEILGILGRYPHNFMENGQSEPSMKSGSVSPIFSRKSIAERGSVDSLVSVGADSVMTNGGDSVLNYPQNWKRAMRAQSLSSVNEETSSLSSYRRSNGDVRARSPLESSSSMELNPLMEQVCERLSAVQLKTPPRPLVINSALDDLWPQPKRITELSGSPWIVPKVATLAVSVGPVPVHEIINVWNLHKPWLEDAGFNLHLDGVLTSNECNQRSSIVCVVDPLLLPSSNHYTITIKEKELNVMCGSIPALHSALVTLVQLLNIFQSNHLSHKDETNTSLTHQFSIPSLVISDFPSIVNRGFLLDMSPVSRIPNLEHLCTIIDCLLALKMNQLHLMFRISMTSSSYSYVREPTLTCPMSFCPSELISVDRYCIDRGISLIPGFDIEDTTNVHPKDLVELVSNSLLHFPSARLVHIGPRLSSYLCESSKSDAHLWRFLTSQHSSTTLMVCANVFHDNKEALDHLPLTAILVEYGFQADYDFSVGCKISVENGRPLNVCPGTAAWTSLSGWPEAGVSNVYSAVVSSLESGATGVVVAHWGHSASLTPFTFTLPPLLVAAGLSWNHNTHWDFVHTSVGSLIDRHLVKVPRCGVGEAIIELGRCETWLTRISRNQSPSDPTNLPSTSPGSTLHQLLCDPDSVALENLGPEHFSSVIRHVRRAVKEKGVCKTPASSPISAGLGQVASLSKWPMTPFLLMELNLAMDMIITACRLGRALVTTGTNPRSNMGIAVVNPGVSNLTPTLRTDLANKVLALKEIYSSIWMHKNQSAGLQASLLVWTSLLARLLPEQNLGPI